MESNGLLKRQRRAHDERVVEVTLTAQGVALRDCVLAIPQPWVTPWG
ncbi:MarR family winged helix-turn-helix transcriptional regulator [Streptomyces sp. NBC_00154]|nr:MarR family winged helix-turn-helix transcriptional regulator [Streptomyces sp. NBC_00154]MCX5317162.1 MarR family winged helix-turn-helix transcriptional regulator [Streptomyces sp. NBC_00154]